MLHVRKIKNEEDDSKINVQLTSQVLSYGQKEVSVHPASEHAFRKVQLSRARTEITELGAAFHYLCSTCIQTLISKLDISFID